MYCELLFAWAKMHKDSDPPICAKVGINWGVGMGLGVLPQNILNLVVLISCILVHLGDGQLEMGNTLNPSDS